MAQTQVKPVGRHIYQEVYLRLGREAYTRVYTFRLGREAYTRRDPVVHRPGSLPMVGGYLVYMPPCVWWYPHSCM